MPGRLEARSGGSIYNRHIVEGLRAVGRPVDVHEIPGDFPIAGPDALAALDAALGGIPDGTPTVVDGLIFGGTPDIATRHAGRLRLVSLVHLPLAANPGLAPAVAATLRALEARALASASHVVITGQATRALLDGYGVDDTRLTLVEPGTARPAPDRLTAARAARAARDAAGAAVRVLCVGTVNPGKGHERLLRALVAAGGDWRLTCAGSLVHRPDTAAALRDRVRGFDCGARVELLGDLSPDALAYAYAEADMFALATERETYGMAVADALAWELPVVSTETGAIPSLVGEGAGVVTPVGDQDAFAAALSRVLHDRALRRTLAAGAALAALRLPAWQDQVAAFSTLLDLLT